MTSLKKAIAEAGLEPPRMLYVAVTGECNLACRHCLVESPRPLGGPGPVAAADVARVVADFVALGGDALCLTGGELLTHPEWPELLRCVMRQAALAEIRLQTNAMLVDERALETLHRLDDGRLSFHVSLDGASAATHDFVRGTGAFAAALAGLKRLASGARAGRITLAFTEMRHNMADIPRLLEFAAELGLAGVTGGTLICGGRAEGEGDLQLPNPEQYRALLDRFYTDPTFHALYERYGRFSAIEWWRGRNGPPQRCCRLIATPYLDLTGALYPCALLQFEEYAGRGVYRESLPAVVGSMLPAWSALEAQCAQRAEELERCLECPAYARCTGGCPGRACSTFGTIRAEEDRCRLRTAVHDWQPSVADG